MIGFDINKYKYVYIVKKLPKKDNYIIINKYYNGWIIATNMEIKSCIKKMTVDEFKKLFI